MQVPAPNIHSGVHQDLPQQLLFSLDSVMAEEGSHEGVHISKRAPLGIAAAALEESQEAGEVMFGRGVCSCLSVGASDGTYDDSYDYQKNQYDPPAEPTEEPAAQQADKENDSMPPDEPPSQPDEKQPDEPATDPAGKAADDKADSKSSPSSASDSKQLPSKSSSSSGDQPTDKSPGGSGKGGDSSDSSKNKGSKKGNKGEKVSSKPDRDPENWDVELILPGERSCLLTCTLPACRVFACMTKVHWPDGCSVSPIHVSAESCWVILGCMCVLCSVCEL